MALAPLPATAQTSALEPTPLLLPWDLRLTPEQFERVCQAKSGGCAGAERGWSVAAGFRLPDGSVLSPDAALVLEERWLAITSEQRRGFPPSISTPAWWWLC